MRQAIKGIPVRIGAAMLAGALTWTAAPEPAAANDAVDVAVVLVADVSNSMSTAERQFVRESHAVAIASPQFAEAIAEGGSKRVALAYVEFAARSVVRIGWTVVDDGASASAFAEDILDLPPVDGSLGGATAIHTGLATAATLLNALPYDAKRLVVDVVGDGRDRNLQALAATRDALLVAGAAINGLPLTNTPDGDAGVLESVYANSVSGGLGHFSLPVTVIDQLPEVMRQKLVQELF